MPYPTVIPPTWHTLTNVDLEARTAVCSICGPTPVNVRPRAGTDRLRVQCQTSRRRERSGASSHHRGGVRSDAERAAALAAQGGRCAICGTPEPGAPWWSDDHDHATGKARGMLCRSCNQILGRVRDDASRLRRMAEYLEVHTRGQVWG